MKIKSIWLSKTTSVCLFLAMAAGTVGFVSSRFPDATNRPLTPAQRAELRKFGKVSGSLAVTISPVGSTVHAAGDNVILEATVMALQSYQDVQYEWVLPEGIVTSATLQADLGPMEFGTTQTIRLEAVSETAENRLIILHAIGANGEQKLGSSAQYNTVDQTRIESQAYSKLQNLKAKSVSTGHKQKMMQ